MILCAIAAVDVLALLSAAAVKLGSACADMLRLAAPLAARIARRVAR